MNNTGYEWCSNVSPSNGGRPSKVKEVVGMDLVKFYELSGGGGSRNGAAKALRKWLMDGGIEVSYPTSKRIIGELIKSGKIKMTKKGTVGMSDFVTPVVNSVP